MKISVITQLQPLVINRSRLGRSTGFSMVEVMVAMVIGLLATIVILQAYAVFEGQKRTTTNNSDTQENGLVALHAIEADARMAGFGLITPNGLACTSMNRSYNGVTEKNVSIAPVNIVDGGAGGSDSVTFTYGTVPSGSNPSILNTTMSDSDADVRVDAINLVGFTLNQDVFLVSTPVLSPGTGTNIPCSRLGFADMNVAVPPPDPVLAYNPPVGTNIFPPGGYLAGQSFVLNMGSFPQNLYAVSGVGATNPDLTVTDVSIPGQAALPLASNIVNIQAQYGVAAVNPNPGLSSPPVTCWTDAAGAGCNYAANGDGTTWANPNAANIMRIKALHVAIVARSSLQEKPPAPNATCNATVNAPASWTGGPVVDLSADPNWRCYRYRVYQTIIPLRNVVWANI